MHEDEQYVEATNARNSNSVDNSANLNDSEAIKPIDFIDSTTSITSVDGKAEDEYVLPQHSDKNLSEANKTSLTDSAFEASNGSGSNGCGGSSADAQHNPSTSNQANFKQNHQCQVGYVRSRLFRDPHDGLMPQAEEYLADASISGSIGSESLGAFSANNNSNTYNSSSNNGGALIGGATTNNNSNNPNANNVNWQLFSVTLHRSHPGGFGIAVVGGRDNPNFCSGDTSIIVSDVIPTGPAFGLLQVNDRIISVNGFSLEYADYAAAISVMKDAEQLNMIVKRRVPFPFVEFEQRTLKFTLSKSHKKDDFGIVLGCRYYIKEITNPKLAEKDPGLKEGDTVLRVNGQSLEAMSLEEATRLLHRSREKLSLVVQRDVRRNPGSGSRWPSQTTVYERLGSISATPRQSPTPVHYTHSANQAEGLPIGASPQLQHNSRKLSDFSPGPKRFSDSVLSAAPSQLGYPSPLPQHHQLQLSQQGTPQTIHEVGNNTQQSFPMMNAYSQQNVNIQQQAMYSPQLSSHHSHHSQQLPPSSNYSQQLNRQSQSPAHNFGMHQQQQLLPPQQKSQTPTSSIMSASSLGGVNGGGNSPLPSSFVGSAQSQQQPAYASTQATNSSIGNGNGNYGYYSTNNAQLAASQQIHHQSTQSIHQLHPTAAVPNNTNSMMRSCAGGGNIPANAASDLRIVNFRKGSGSLGIRVIGGNQVGIFVSVVQEDSPAAKNGIRVGDRLLMVNGYNMSGVTREQAVEYLLGLGDEVNVHVEHSVNEDFSHIKGGQMGDSFYIRTHFTYQKRSSRQELSFNAGDIFHVTDTLAGGSVGYWQVTKVYSANETEIKSNEASGIIPNSKTAETLAKQSRMDSSTLGRSIFRKKLQSHRTSKSLTTTNTEDEFMNGVVQGGSANADIIPPPAYERVALKKPAFHRPVVLFGPLADVARQLLLTIYPLQFGAVTSMDPGTSEDPSAAILRMSSIDAVMAAQKHCVLSISPGSVERLQLAQYAPIVVLIDVDGRSRIRDLRAKSGAPTASARKFMEQAAKIKKHHSYLLTATLDASKEDGWFEALRHLVFHLQERRVWMPEFQPTQPIDDLLLFPLQNCNLSEAADSETSSAKPPPNAGNNNDYGIYDATSMSTASVQSTPAHKITTADRRATTPGDMNAKMMFGAAGSGFPSGAMANGGKNSPFFSSSMAQARNSPFALQAREFNAPGTSYDVYNGGGFHQQQQLNRQMFANMQQSAQDFQQQQHQTNNNNTIINNGGTQRPMSASANSAYAVGGDENRGVPATSPRHFLGAGVNNGGRLSAASAAPSKSPTPSWAANSSGVGRQEQMDQTGANNKITSSKLNFDSSSYNDDPILKHYLPDLSSPPDQMNEKSNNGTTQNPSTESVVTMNANFSLRRTAPSPKSAPKTFGNKI